MSTEPNTTAHLLHVDDLTRRFVRRGTPFDAVSHVDLDVDAGDFVAVVGRSGNGKSTLINMIAGLVRPTEGTVEINGRTVAELNDRELSRLRNRVIGFVTQSQTLLSNLTVLDNVILPAVMFPGELPASAVPGTDAESTGTVDDTVDTVDTADTADTDRDTPDTCDTAAADMPEEADPDMPDVIMPADAGGDAQDPDETTPADPLAERAMALLGRLGVADLADSLPRELSGGEMRRVSIARALMNAPELLIADEPTGDLDQESTVIVMELLRALADDGTAILMVTHDPDALRYADRVYRMDAGVLSRA